MRRIPAALAASAVLALLLASVASGAVVRHDKRQAEVNVLRATRVLDRWNVGLADPRTKLLKAHTLVVCRGQGRSLAGRHSRYLCEVRNKRVVVLARYDAYARGFALKKLRVNRL